MEVVERKRKRRDDVSKMKGEVPEGGTGVGEDRVEGGRPSEEHENIGV